MPKRSTIGTSPLDAVIPTTSAEPLRKQESIPDVSSKRQPPQRVSPAEINDAKGSIAPVYSKTPVVAKYKERLTVHIPSPLVERCRNAVYWTPGLTLAGLAEEALTKLLDAMEQARGESFVVREGELKKGRPVT